MDGVFASRMRHLFTVVIDLDPDYSVKTVPHDVAVDNGRFFNLHMLL